MIYIATEDTEITEWSGNLIDIRVIFMFYSYITEASKKALLNQDTLIGWRHLTVDTFKPILTLCPLCSLWLYSVAEILS